MGWMLRPIDPAAEAAIRADPIPPPLGGCDALSDDLRAQMIAKYTADRDDPATPPSLRRLLDQYLVLLRAPRVRAVEEARASSDPTTVGFDLGSSRRWSRAPPQIRAALDIGTVLSDSVRLVDAAEVRRWAEAFDVLLTDLDDPRTPFCRWANDAPVAVRDRSLELAAMFIETAKKGWALVFEERPEFSGLF